MILPTGERDLELRRLPWVTFGVMLACLAAFPLLRPAPTGDPPGDPAALLAEAADYWRERAYLLPEAEILIEVGRGLDPAARSDLVDRLRHESYRRWPSDERVRKAEQGELDDLTRRALRALAQSEEAPRLGFVPAAPSVQGFFGHVLAHRDWVQLLANVLLWFLAAAALEATWGYALFAAFVAIGLVSGAGFYWLMVPAAKLPLLGLSGLVGAAVGASLVRFRSRGVRVHYRLWRERAGELGAPAWGLLPLWLGCEVLQALQGPVPYQASVGGLLAGIGVAAVLLLLDVETDLGVEQPSERRARPRAARRRGDGPVDEAQQLQRRGQIREAFELLQAEARRHADDADTVLAFWEASVACQRADAASPSMLRLVKECVGRGEMALAARYWSEVIELVPTARADPAALARLADALVKLGQTGRAVLALRHAIDRRNKGLTGEVALRVASEARELGEAAIAVEAAQRALQFPDLDSFKRARMQELLAELEPKPEQPEDAVAAPAETPGAEAERAPPTATTEPRRAGPDPLGAAARTPELSPPAPAEEAVRDEAPPAPRGTTDEDPEPSLEAADVLDDDGLPALEGPVDEDLAEVLPEAAVLVPDDSVPELEGPVDEDLEAPLEVADLAADEAIPALEGPVDEDLAEAQPEERSAGPGDGVGGPESRTLERGSGEHPSLAEPLVEALPTPDPRARPDVGSQTSGGSAVPPSPFDGEPVDSSVVRRFSGVKVVEGAPDRLGEDALSLRLRDGRITDVEYTKVQALAAVGVRTADQALVVVIDLALNWQEVEEGPLHVLRMRGDEFDPRDLVGDSGSLAEAFRVLLHQLLTLTDAVPLPDADSARGLPLRTFADLESYQREVLDVDC